MAQHDQREFETMTQEREKVKVAAGKALFADGKHYLHTPVIELNGKKERDF